jgi:hypothetical protein
MRPLISLILGCVLCGSMSVGRDTHAYVRVEWPASSQASTSSRSPSPNYGVDGNHSNVFRRFFTWTFDRLARPFRRQPQVVCKLPLVISSVSASTSLITFCPATGAARSNLECSSNREVALAANGAFDATEVLYTWSVTGGRLQGEGRQVTWDLSGLAEGAYTATVEVNDGYQHTANGSTTVTIALCSGCEPPPPICPKVSVSCSSRIANQPLMFEATPTGEDPEMKPTYTWTVTAGKIIGGQGTSRLMVDITDLGTRSITATVSLSGIDPACTISQASCTTNLH